MATPVEVVFLGTGTSQGIPVIGCDCRVCVSDDPRDSRYRSSVLIKTNDHHILVDVSPDFRRQMLDAGESRVDTILLTHEHNDHIIGLDDVRPINFKYHKNIPVYGLERVLDQVKTTFYYAFADSRYPGAPRLHCLSVEAGKPFTLPETDIEIFPLLLYHAELEIIGFRIQQFAYITDASLIPPASMDMLKGLDVLVINALQRQKHYSHFTLEEALDVIHVLKPGKAYLTHISHHLGTTGELLQELPADILPAYDNLRIKI